MTKDITAYPAVRLMLTPPCPGMTLRLDETVTDRDPVITWMNSNGGIPPRTYILQLDASPSFDSVELLEQREIPESIHTSSVRVGSVLRDHTTWYWRVKAVDAAGAESPWSTEAGGITARFLTENASENPPSFRRLPVSEVRASSGEGAERIIDCNRENATFWEGAEGEEEYLVSFDLGEEQDVGRIFQTCARVFSREELPESSAGWADAANLDGRLREFIWSCSLDGRSFSDIPETGREKSDAFREILDLRCPIRARYLRIRIRGWYGKAPRLYDVSFYCAGTPPLPAVPEGDYVLVIDNYSDAVSEPGRVRTDFGKMIRGMEGQKPLPWDLEVLELPARDVPVKMLENMAHKPAAIFLTGSTNFYCQLPMFEFAGEMDLIRGTEVPVWGACAGLQVIAMAYGSTHVASAGRSYLTEKTADILEGRVPSIRILKDDPIFAGVCDPFYGTELHSLMVRCVPKEFDLLAASEDEDGLFCVEMIRIRGRNVYGSQFHPEIPKPFNTSRAIILNFLRMAMERAGIKRRECKETL